MSTAGGQTLRRTGAVTFGFSALTLVVNAVTGILVARALGTSGRGEVAAILALPQLLGWMFAFSCGQALSYYRASNPGSGGVLIGTWLVLLAPLGLVAALAGELLVPAVFAAQTNTAQDLARVFVPTVFLIVYAEIIYGVLLGDEDFNFYNAVRFLQAAATAILYAVLWPVGALTVKTALAGFFATSALTAVVITWRALGRHGVSRPSLPVARNTLWYGLRAHSYDAAGIVNARLDLVIMPAFLSASSVGLYSVATNVSWVIVSLAGALQPIVLPLAARGREAGAEMVRRSLRMTLAVGLVLALAIGLAADFVVPLVYGHRFADSALPLRLLLPGCVLYAGAGVVVSGLQGANRPLTAGIAEAAGVVVTVVGLVLFLRPGGIKAAAIVSTVSYSLVFVVVMSLYSKVVGLRWRELMSPRAWSAG